jgi:hypothetical protein
MAFSQGSRTRLSFIEEVTFGTTPSGNFTEIPFSTHSLNLTKERVEGSDILADRMPRVDRHGNRSAAGDIVADLRADAFDAFLESMMFDVWDTSPSSAPDELKVGTTLKSFSIEDYASDIDQARLFTGMAVSQGQFSIAPNQMITSTFSFVGKDGTISQSEKSVNAASTNTPFDSYSGAITLGNTGGALSSLATVTSVDFSVNNALSPTFVVGSDSTPQLEFGRAVIEGSISAYFEDAALINRFLDETETAFKVTVNDPTGGNEYGFFFPRVKFNSANAEVGGPESRMVAIDFVALYDATEGSNLTITLPDST